MGSSCKGICVEFKGEKIQNGSKYDTGQKRCSLCCIFLTITSNRCPCCGILLRTKPRSRKKLQIKNVHDYYMME